MDDKLVTVGEYETSFEANIAKLELDSNDINSFVLGEYLGSAIPTIGIVRVELQVFAKDADRAKEILQAAANQPEQPDQSEQESDQ